MLDIVIPCLDTDIPMLKRCVPFLRENVTDGVGEIFVVSKRYGQIRKICKGLGCQFVDEIEFMGFDKNELGDIPFNRNGWLYQQLIKLSGDRLSSSDDFLVCDADHVLLKPHKFVVCGGYNFYYTGEYHIPYFRVIEKLFNGKYAKKINQSFISDKIVMNKGILSQMKDEIESYSKKGWIDTIVDNYDKETQSGFSEFETYGTFISNIFIGMVNMIDANRYMETEENIASLTNKEMKEKYNGFASVTQFKNE